MNRAVPEPVTRLIQSLSRLPGVGPKSASRLAYFLLRSKDELIDALIDALQDLKDKTTFCAICGNITVDDPCPICADSHRDASLVMVVEEPLDVLAMERTGAFQGVYHVLHGALSPVNGVSASDIRIAELVERVGQGGIHEVIIATNPGMEGDMTARYIQGELKSGTLRVTGLARGLPTGGDIEYVDTVTLMRALQGRSDL